MRGLWVAKPASEIDPILVARIAAAIGQLQDR